MNGSPHQFKTLLPKLYSEKMNTEQFHYMAVEDGRIKGIVGSFPIQLKYGDNVLNCAMIGSVSVHPTSREKGYMKKLMEMAIEDMKQQGVHFSCLSGQRQRYAYYGYERIGYRYHYYIGSVNIKHCYSKFPIFQLELKEIQEKEQMEESVYSIYEKKEPKVLREKENFFHICKSWNAKIIGIWLKETLVGYLCVSGNQILECVLEEEKYLFSTLAEYFQMTEEKEVALEVQPYEWERQAILNQFAEQSSLQIGANYRIFDYKRVIEFYLKIKASYELLEDGELRLAIMKKDRTKEMIEIRVEEGKISVSSYEDLAMKEDIFILSEEELMQIAFTPLPIWEKEKRKIQKYRSWFPLPLGISEQDLC